MCCVGGAQDEARMKGFIFISLGGGGGRWLVLCDVGAVCWVGSWGLCQVLLPSRLCRQVGSSCVGPQHLGAAHTQSLRHDAPAPR